MLYSQKKSWHYFPYLKPEIHEKIEASTPKNSYFGLTASPAGQLVSAIRLSSISKKRIGA